jgi:uncharacterized protein
VKKAHPVTPAERIAMLDALRGLSLYGVLLVNLVEEFRVSLFAYLRTFHTDSSQLDHRVDDVLAVFFEQKAMVIFSFLFGVGLGIVAGRARERGLNVRRFLLRRYASLLLIGVVHLVLVWDGDILTEYAIAALLVAPLVDLRPRTLSILGLALLVWWLFPHPTPGFPFPTDATMARLANAARAAYGEGSWAAAQSFRIEELQAGILPLLVSVLPRTLGLFLLGMAASFVVRHPPRRVLAFLVVLGLPLGLVLATLEVLAAEGVLNLGRPPVSVGNVSVLSLGFAYVGAFVLAFEKPWFRRHALLLAPIGRMALTSYLAQSLLSIGLFYGVGLGLMNRIGSAAGMVLATGIFVAQAWFCARWLERWRFGPVEYLWRRLVYGRLEL